MQLCNAAHQARIICVVCQLSALGLVILLIHVRSRPCSVALLSIKDIAVGQFHKQWQSPVPNCRQCRLPTAYVKTGIAAVSLIILAHVMVSLYQHCSRNYSELAIYK